MERRAGLGLRDGAGGVAERGCSGPLRELKDHLAELGWNRRDVVQPIATFVKRLVKLGGPTAVGILYRDEGYVRPVVDVLLLWSAPLDLDDHRQSEQIDRFAELHGELALALDPHLDTSLDFLDPEGCPTVSQFETTLREGARRANDGRLLACFRLPALVS